MLREATMITIRGRAQMSDASKEMVKQLGLYADTITAFATVQLLGFIYLIAQGGCFSKNVLTAIWLPIGIGSAVSAGYIGLVCLCHRAEDRIFATKPETIEKRDKVIQDIVKGLRTTHKTIVVVDWVATIVVLLLIHHGVSIGRFCFDCKK
jgi:hypothetical protein